MIRAPVRTARFTRLLTEPRPPASVIPANAGIQNSQRGFHPPLNRAATVRERESCLAGWPTSFGGGGADDHIVWPNVADSVNVRNTDRNCFIPSIL